MFALFLRDWLDREGQFKKKRKERKCVIDNVSFTKNFKCSAVISEMLEAGLRGRLEVVFATTKKDTKNKRLVCSNAHGLHTPIHTHIVQVLHKCVSSPLTAHSSQL